MTQIVETLEDPGAIHITTPPLRPVPPRVDQDPPETSIDQTTEFRWFFDGPLPADVRAWFMPNGVGLIEHRCDTYVLNAGPETGVKRRSRQLLELKIRTRPAEKVVIGENVHGRMETWQRWSPADGFLSLDDTAEFIDVHKTIVKRRFGTDGQELMLTESTRAMNGDGCDAEIVDLSVNGRCAWTFAFAAFGQPDGQLASVSAAWRSLVVTRPRPAQLRLHLGRSCGYPEWITNMTNTVG